MDNITIEGVGKINGGTYDNIKVSGTASVSSDIVANTVKVSGIATFENNLKTSDLKVSGLVKVNGNMMFTNATISGLVQVRGKVEGEVLKADGGISVSQDINVEKMEATIGKGSFNNIYGNDIKIDSKKHLIICKEIEATNIDVTYLKADRISGNNVVIGPNCDIGIVEYSEKLSINIYAKIRKVVKL